MREFIGAEGVRIAADVGGDPARPWVILSHGGGQTRYSWARAMDELVRAGFYVVNHDLRGHGDSGWSPSGAYSLKERAQDIRAITADNRSGIALVGASMGGNTSLYAALTSEGLDVKAVVLVDIVPNPSPEGVERVRAFMTRYLDGFESLEAAANAVASYNPHRVRPPDPSGLSKNLRKRGGRFYWHWDPAIVGLGREGERDSLLDALRAPPRLPNFPVLLVRGLLSDVISDEGVAEMRQYLPQTEVLDVSGAGHMVAGDNNDAFNAGVIRFLERHISI
jgi:pimeloyl-ACP methyl ester carboxylesterase